MIVFFCVRVRLDVCVGCKAFVCVLFVIDRVMLYGLISCFLCDVFVCAVAWVVLYL